MQFEVGMNEMLTHYFEAFQVFFLLLLFWSLRQINH